MDLSPLSFDSPTHTLATFWRVVGAILGQQWSAVGEVLNDPRLIVLALQIVALAGLSEALGQSVVLFVHRVRPRRFVLSLLISVVMYTLGYLLWVTSVWVVGQVVFDKTTSFPSLARAIGLGYAPMLFGFLGLLPYTGTGVLRLLYLWTFLSIVQTTRLSLGLALWQAALCASLGGLVLLVLRATLGRSLMRAVRHMREQAAGAPLHTNIHDIVTSLLQPDDVLPDGTQELGRS